MQTVILGYDLLLTRLNFTKDNNLENFNLNRHCDDGASWSDAVRTMICR